MTKSKATKAQEERVNAGETFVDRAGTEIVTDTLVPYEEAQANAEVAAEDKSGETKCDNHPHRYGRNFTGGGSYSINLCDDCTPPWFKDEE